VATAFNQYAGYNKSSYSNGIPKRSRPDIGVRHICLERGMIRLVCAALALCAGLPPAEAHFLELLPSADVLPEGGPVQIDIVFTHPMARGPVMEMAKPKRVGVVTEAGTADLTAALVEKPVAGKRAWTLSHALEQPGTALYFVEPQPYWEPAERKYILHYAKVAVDGFASGEGWDRLVGLPVEIEPLSRPAGLWTGNLFRGIVRADGKPVPFAEVEVEWVNDGLVTPPNDAFLTQVIKADGNGVFAYAMPRAGWWGFAALIDGPEAKGPDGKPAKTELGGLIWIKATDMAATR
jgi:cobalt/nickel transport protein